MGDEIHYCYRLDEECHNCNNGINLNFDVWEYPVGIINMTKEDASGADIIECSFDIKYVDPNSSTVS